MHDYELAYLDKLQRGEIRVNNMREVTLAAPHLFSLIKHDNPALIERCFYAYLSLSGLHSLNRYWAAFDFYTVASTDKTPWQFDTQIQLLKQLTPDPAEPKDLYWLLLTKIAKQAAKEDAPKIAQWALTQFAHPEFNYFTSRESERRYRKREKSFYRAYNKPDEKPYLRRSKNEVYDVLVYILVNAVLKGNEPLAVQTAQLIKQKFAYQQKHNDFSDSFMGFDSEWDISGDAYTPPARLLQQRLNLLDKIDSVLGTKNTRHGYMKAKFLAALSQDDKDIQRIFKNYMQGLNKKQKLAFLESRNYLHYDAPFKGQKTDYSHQFLFCQPDSKLLHRFLECLNEWDSDYRLKQPCYRRTFLKRAANGLSERSYETDKNNTTGKVLFSRFDIIHNFAPQLTWKDIAERLNMLRREFPQRYKNITLRNKEYFEAALDRAHQYGHARDFKMLWQMAQRFDKGQSSNRRNSARSTGKIRRKRHRSYRHIIHWSFIRRKISRSPAYINAIGEFIAANGAALETDNYRNGYDAISKLADITHNQEYFYDRGISYFDKGRAFTKHEYTSGLPAAYTLMGDYHNALKFKKDKSAFCEESFGSTKLKNRSNWQYARFNDTLRSIEENKDFAALMAMTKFWYETARQYYPQKACRQIQGKIAETAFSIWHSWDDPQPIQEFLDFVISHNKDDAAIMLFNTQGSGLGGMLQTDRFQAFKIMQLYPDLTTEQDKKALSGPLYQQIFELMEIKERNRQKWLAAGLEIPNTSMATRHPPTNFNTRLYNAFLPLMRHYAKMEKTNQAEYFAMKYAILFPNINKASKYLHNHGEGATAVHDAGLFALPDKGDWDKELWANLAIRWGNGALRWLPFAPQLEAAVMQINKGKPRRDHFKLSECKPNDLRALAHEYCSYKRKDEAPELATTLFDNGVSEQYFNESLALTQSFNAAAQNKAPAQRCLPNIFIEGADIGHPNFRLETLPRGDARNLWMGQYVNSCMHIANQGRDLALAMFDSDDAASYVVRRIDEDGASSEIIASFHSFLSQKGNMVFNTWQRRNKDYDFLRGAFIDAAAKAVMDKAPKINRVVMGQGRMEKEDFPKYEYIEGDRFGFTDIATKGGEVNKHGDHYTGDTQIGQFVIARRTP